MKAGKRPKDRAKTTRKKTNNAMTPQQKSYLTPNEVCDRYKGKITLKTLANWRTTGGGPKFSRLGGRILYPELEVERWETRHTVSSTSEYGTGR